MVANRPRRFRKSSSVKRGNHANNALPLIYVNNLHVEFKPQRRAILCLVLSFHHRLNEERSLSAEVRREYDQPFALHLPRVSELSGRHTKLLKSNASMVWDSMV